MEEWDARVEKSSVLKVYIYSLKNIIIVKQLKNERRSSYFRNSYIDKNRELEGLPPPSPYSTE